VFQVDVVRRRSLSRSIAERLEVRHESPQVILLREGRAAWVASHGKVDADALEEQVGAGGCTGGSAIGAGHRLAVYGSLAPGEVNHAQLAGLSGTWRDGSVRGDLLEAGWGATLGFRALVWRADGPEVPVKLFESDELPAHWARLDAFEGEGYRRIVVPVRMAEGEVGANIYVLNPVPPRRDVLTPCPPLRNAERGDGESA
jgi:gamma-glutamylcyclotransferase (GGCT)/AIG2-like uncharacterized protein YtfP